MVDVDLPRSFSSEAVVVRREGCQQYRSRAEPLPVRMEARFQIIVKWVGVRCSSPCLGRRGKVRLLALRELKASTTRAVETAHIVTTLKHKQSESKISITSSNFVCSQALYTKTPRILHDAAEPAATSWQSE